VREVKIVLEKPTHAAMQWGNLFVGLWRGTPTLEAAANFEKYLLEAAARYQSFGAINIIQAGIPAPLMEVQKSLVACMDRVPDLLFLAGVLESTDLAARVLRGVIKAMSFVSQKSYPQNAFDSVPRAASWAASFYEKHRDHDASAGAIEAAIAEFRRKIAAPPAP